MSFPNPDMDRCENDPQLLRLMHAYMKESQTDESFEFLFTAKPNKEVYRTYIAVDSPREVNLPEATRRPLDVLAAAKQWDAMDKGLADARKFIRHMIDRNSIVGFKQYPPYLRYCVAKYQKNTDRGVRARTALAKELKDKKTAPQLAGLMLILEGGRTAVDRKKAYTAIKALLKDPAKINAICQTAGFTLAL